MSLGAPAPGGARRPARARRAGPGAPRGPDPTPGLLRDRGALNLVSKGEYDEEEVEEKQEEEEVEVEEEAELPHYGCQHGPEHVIAWHRIV